LLVAIRAWLRGELFDLELLTELFPAGDPYVAVGTDGYYLTANAFDPLFHDGRALSEAAQVILRRANGAVRALNPDFRPVTLAGKFSDETGHHTQVILPDDRLTQDQAVAAGTANGEEQPPGPAIPHADEYVALAATNPDVAEVLDILGKTGPTLNWSDLHRVYEIVNGSTDIKQAGWVPAKRLDLFARSRSRAPLSRADARHARDRIDVPAGSMSLAEGRDLTGDFVTRWLDHLLVGSGHTPPSG
jgi:hypothetical protein